MAALSVESARLGKNTVTPISAALVVKRSRSSELAATPPETRLCGNWFAPRHRARALRDLEQRRPEILQSGPEFAGCTEAVIQPLFLAGLKRLFARFDFFGKFRVRTNIIQHSGLDAAETEIEWIAFDFYGIEI